VKGTFGCSEYQINSIFVTIFFFFSIHEELHVKSNYSLKWSIDHNHQLLSFLMQHQDHYPATLLLMPSFHFCIFLFLSISFVNGIRSALAWQVKDSAPLFCMCWAAVLCSQPQGSLLCNWMGSALRNMAICNCKACQNHPQTIDCTGRQHKNRVKELFRSISKREWFKEIIKNI